MSTTSYALAMTPGYASVPWGLDVPRGPRRVLPVRPEGRWGPHLAANVLLRHWGRSSAGRAPDWQSGGSRVQVPSPPPKGFPPKIRTATKGPYAGRVKVHTE